MAVVLLGAVAWMRPDIRNPVDDTSFFRMKLAWRDTADVVVLGDSQVYRGIDPEAFAEHCPGPRTLNFGFSSVLLRRPYVEASVAVLRMAGPKVLLVGISSLQFKSEQLSDGFLEARRRDMQFRLPWQFEAYLQPLLQRLRPLEIPIPAEQLVSWIYRRDGFVAGNSPKVVQDSIRYVNDYAVHPFSEKMYQSLLNQLQSLQRHGYRVLVFSTYSSPAFERIDTRMSGLDDKKLAHDLHALGLDYLPVATHGLRSYDGIHLDAASAALFSRRLGAAVKGRAGSSLCALGRRR